MSRGIRTLTRKFVQVANEQKPLAIGPLFGQLSMHFNVSASMIAELLKVHEQTILRWYMGRSDPPAGAFRKIAPLLAFLLWMYQESALPLVGNAKKRKREFAQRYKEYEALD
jgi:hypothetical protein